MKKIILFIIVVCSLVVVSCTNENYLVYDAEQPNKITFAQDTVLFNFGFEADQDIDLIVPVNLFGFVSKNGTVPYKIVAAAGSDAVEGDDYTIVESVFEQDSTTSEVKLNFKKDALTPNRIYKLILELQSDENYTVTLRKQCCVLFGNNKLEQPKWWRPQLLGIHTQEKHVFFVNLFWKTEELSPAIYTKIAVSDKFGHNLDGTYIRWGEDFSHTLLTIAAYTDFFRRYVTTPMYEYYLKTGDPKYEMPNPIL